MNDKWGHPFHHELMKPAWAACMSWAIRQDDMRAAFEAESGMRYIPPKSGLELMIGDATGAGEKYAEAFTVWATRNVWGTPDGVPERIAAMVTDWPEEQDDE